jgi:hypothetical protein
MSTPELIARIAERFPDLGTVDVPVHRAAVEAHRAEMERVVAAGAGNKLHPAALGPLSENAVDQATEHLAQSTDDQVRESVAHQVFNMLRGQLDDIDGAKYDDVVAALRAMGV